MNLNALRNFIAVVEAGSMREAADTLHVAQSALSRQILGLEREFGAPLLERLPRGVTPTPAGRIVLRLARQTLDQMRTARDEVAAFEGLRTGLVRVAAIEPFAQAPLADCIARFRAAYPGVSLDVRVGSTRLVASLVRERVAELGVTYNVPREPGLAVRASVRQPLVALMRPCHPLAQAGTIDLPALAAHPVILPPSGSPTRLLIEEAARRAGLHFSSCALESDSVGLRLATARRTDAVAILGHLSGLESCRRGELAMVALDDPLLADGRLELLAAAGGTLSRAAAAFERHMRAALKGLDGPDRAPAATPA